VETAATRLSGPAKAAALSTEFIRATSQLNAGTDFGPGFFVLDRCVPFAPSGLVSPPRIPTAYAVGCILSLLRGSAPAQLP